MRAVPKLGGLAAIFVCARLAAAAPAPAPAPVPSLAEASGRVQAGDAAGATAILEDLLARNPSDDRAWRLLGYASLLAKNFDLAIVAYAQTLTLAPDTPAALYNLGVAYARKGERDAAFRWLEAAKATRKLDMAQISTDDDLASLRDDPRFAALLPKPEDFRHPFVENVVVLREWDGEAAGDQFGWIARPLGDVDGDGVPDFVTSAPTKEIGGPQAGRVYVYSTKTGRLVWSVDGHPGDRLGTGVESAGDVDGDGVSDVVAGAPGAEAAYVYSGRDGHLLFTMHAEDKGDVFGRHVSGAGDLDGDGHADVVIGAPGNGAGGTGAGRAYVYSGRDGRLMLTLTGERPGDGFGSTVAGAVEAGRAFLIVGAPRAGPRRSGRVYVYPGLAKTPSFVIDSDETGAALGAMFVSVVGDVDGDGVPDVYAADFTNAAKGPSTGRVYVHSGATGRRLRTLTGETAGEGFGIGPATAGDVDGDGRADLIVGAWQYAGAAGSGGRAYLFSGKDGRLLRAITCRVPGDTFGFDAVGIGDVDGDGTADLLLTSAWSGIRGFHSGRVFVLSSGIHPGP